MKPAGLRVQIMGPMRVWLRGAELDTGPRQQRRLLALLVARAGHPVGMSDLITLLWGTEPPASAVNVIHKYIGVLRRLFEPALQARSSGSYLIRHADGYCFAGGAGILDLADFRRIVDAAGAGGLPDEEALDRYADALRLCHGPAGEGLASTAGGAAVLTAVDAEFLAATVAAAEIAVRVGRPSRVLNALRLAADMAPGHERVQASLMAVLAAADRESAMPGDRGRPAGDPRPAAMVRPAQLPPDLPVFTGRSAELATLGGLVAGRRSVGRTGPLVVALSGAGGVGKSALATRFAHRVAAGFPDGQLFLDLRGDRDDAMLSTSDALQAFLHALGVPRSGIPDLPEARMGLYRSLTAGKRVLVLLDDVRDPVRVRPLLPNSAHSLVLVTSRRPLVGLAAFEGADLLRVGRPDPAAARELFSRRIQRPGPAPKPDPAPDPLDEIVGWCDRLPLALAIQGARLHAQPSLTPAAVAAELRDIGRRLDAFSCGPGLSDPRAVLSWSYRLLSPGAATLFRLLSLVPGPNITVAAAAALAGRDVGRTRADLAELAEPALVTDDDRGLFRIGSLAGAYAAEVFRIAGTPAERRTATGRLLRHHLHSSYHARSALGAGEAAFALPAPPPGVVPERPASPAEAMTWFAARRDMLTAAVRAAAELGYGVEAGQLALCLQPFLERSGLLQERDEMLGYAPRRGR
ncbi:BTAD domain-containing putative transcriptional regulator [Actinoplanes sp. NPDC051494]|uniref:AfsR/SARP family transcriptional regulator n=1 Tax=Actinoplanes sp. NPDC051494 TaxID=3363907 RepID=UPI00379FC308